MQTTMNATLREETGKEAARRLRKESRIPAVLYGHEFEPILITLDSHDLTVLLRRQQGIHGLVDLKIEGKKGGKHTVVVKEMQRHPTKDTVLHVDFQRVKETEKLQTEVPVLYHGEPEGVKAGGLLQHYIYGVRVETLPKDLPDRIDLDINDLELGQGLKVSDLPELPGVVYLNSPEEIMVAVITRRVKMTLSVEEEEAEAAAEAAAAAEATAAGTPGGAEQPEASE
jgi:large subunit ribosomal protein L25